MTRLVVVWLPLLASLLVGASACGRGVPPTLEAPRAARTGLADGSPLSSLPWLTDGYAIAVGRINDEAGQLRCTGALVGEAHVLTAAHCLALAADATEFEVATELAGLGFRVGGELLPLTGLSRHAELDLAVLRLGASVAGGTATPFPLSSAFGDELIGREVVGLGSGRGTPVDEEASAGVFTVVAVEPTQLELGPTGAAQLCPGDSGAPVLLYENDALSLVGIHSIGHDDCSPAWYPVRIDVAADWVTETIASLPMTSVEPCDEQVDDARCVDDVAQNCVAAFWWSLDCGLARRVCSAPAGLATCDAVPCGDVPPAGVCEDGVARVCLVGSLIEDDCAALGLGCALDPATGRRACVDCTACDGECVELATDSRHCGECGNGCVPDGRGQCTDGECTGGDVDDPPAADAGVVDVPPPAGCQGCSAGLALFVALPLQRLRRRRRSQHGASRAP